MSFATIAGSIRRKAVSSPSLLLLNKQALELEIGREIDAKSRWLRSGAKFLSGLIFRQEESPNPNNFSVCHATLPEVSWFFPSEGRT
jgi:hypothetical protein